MSRQSRVNKVKDALKAIAKRAGTLYFSQGMQGFQVGRAKLRSFRSYYNAAGVPVKNLTRITKGDVSRAFAELAKEGVIDPSNDKLGPRGGPRVHQATFNVVDTFHPLPEVPPNEPSRRTGWDRFRSPRRPMQRTPDEE